MNGELDKPNGITETVSLEWTSWIIGVREPKEPGVVSVGFIQPNM